MADFTIAAPERHPLLNVVGDAPIDAGFTATSDAPTVATMIPPGGMNGTAWSVRGVSAGTANVTVVRTVDGFAVTKSVAVTAATPFDWHLGAALDG